MTQAQIKALIDEKITTNGEQEITGAVLNNVLQAIADACGYTFDIEVYPADAALEVTFYNPSNPDGEAIKINADVSNLGNSKLEAISAWWAAQKERRINEIGGFTIEKDSITDSSPSTLGLFQYIDAGQIIDSMTNATSLIFFAEDTTYVTVNSTDLPYTAQKRLVSVESPSGTLTNVKIHVQPANFVSVSQNIETGDDTLKLGNTITGVFADANKLIKIKAFIDTQASLNVGDVWYNTGAKQLRKKTGQYEVNYELIPFYDGAIYTYNNKIYIWNGTDLVQNYANPIYTLKGAINDCIAYMYSDNMPSGSYFYQFTKTANATTISIRNNDTTIARLAISEGAVSGKVYEIPEFNDSGYNAYIVFTDSTFSQSAINVPIFDVIRDINYSGPIGSYLTTLQFTEDNYKKTAKYYVKNLANAPELFIKNFKEGISDLAVVLSSGNVNGILNLTDWMEVPNDTGIVRTEWQGHNKKSITGTLSDLISAWFIKAVNNADGDLNLGVNDWSPTGGWHGYNAATQGTPSKTGRTLWYKVYADENEVAVGKGSFCNRIKIQWCNRVQACNTEKADGSGREVVEEIITLICDEGMKVKACVEAKILEDVTIQHHYGLNTYNACSLAENINGEVIFVGDNDMYEKDVTGEYNHGVKSQDKNCSAILFRGENYSFVLSINPASVGNFKYCTQPTGGSGQYGVPQYKGMLRTLDAPEDSPIAFAEGSSIIVEGFYDCYPTKFSVE